tara:strand:- start:204 stop:455 length:252 start_codon:yes stop_codon:yes gene_type:complete
MNHKVRVSDGGGHWIDSDGELMTTVWTSEGWKDLPGEYEVHHKFLECECPDKEWLNLTIVIEDNNEIRFLNVQNADFEEVEDD